MPLPKTIKIKNLKIPVEIKSYKTSKTVRIYFKGDTLKITKPKYLSIKKLLEILKEDENKIYEKYKEISISEKNSRKQWQTGEKINYKGLEFLIKREYENINQIKVKIDENKKELIIIVPTNLSQEDLKESVDKNIKKIFKNNTEVLINKRLPYWSNITKIEYNLVKIRDATSRYGSCMPTKKNLYFSSRLIMLPEYIVDAIIVHELCHMKHKNHSKEFYALVESYIHEYKKIDKWLKQNGESIIF